MLPATLYHSVASPGDPWIVTVSRLMICPTPIFILIVDRTAGLRR